MRKIYCDRCKNEISGAMNVTRVSFSEQKDLDGAVWERISVLPPRFEVCKACFWEILNVALPRIPDKGGRTAQVNFLEGAGKDPTKKKLDKDKVEALFKAGWSVEKVADEFNAFAADFVVDENGEYWA